MAPDELLLQGLPYPVVVAALRHADAAQKS